MKPAPHLITGIRGHSHRPLLFCVGVQLPRIPPRILLMSQDTDLVVQKNATPPTTIPIKEDADLVPRDRGATELFCPGMSTGSGGGARKSTTSTN